MPASGDGGAKWLIDADQDNNVLVDGKTPVYVSTNQSIGGIKTFTETPLIRRTGYYTGLNFQAQPNTTGRTGGITQYVDTSRTFFYFDQYHMSGGVQTTYLDQYRFPDSGTDNANHTYYFLTTKSAVTIDQGGTGATSAANARYNLGIGCTQLYSGTLTSGSTTFNYGNYSAYLIYGLPSGETSICSIIVPKAMLTTSNVKYEIGVGSVDTNFYLKYSGTTVTLTWNAGGSITKVYGMN